MPTPSTAFAAVLLAAAPLSAQCTGEGSRAVPGGWSDGPPIGCGAAPWSPAWSIWTPPHRVVVPEPGSTFRTAWVLPRRITRYRCTDLWLHPRAVASVHVYGYVLDIEVAPCR